MEAIFELLRRIILSLNTLLLNQACMFKSTIDEHLEVDLQMVKEKFSPQLNLHDLVLHFEKIVKNLCDMAY